MDSYKVDLQAIEKDTTILEQELGLDSGFISSLEHEDDWSFIIKSHTLIEAALTSWLSSHLGKPALIDPLSYLEIGHPRYGKVALTKVLGLSTPYDRRFIKELSSLRNQVAHRIENATFFFDIHISKLNKQQRENFIEAFSYFYIRAGQNGKILFPDDELIIKRPKNAILNGIKMFLAIVALDIKATKLETRIAQFRKELFHYKGQTNK